MIHIEYNGLDAIGFSYNSVAQYPEEFLYNYSQGVMQVIFTYMYMYAVVMVPLHG